MRCRAQYISSPLAYVSKNSIAWLAKRLLLPRRAQSPLEPPSFPCSDQLRWLVDCRLGCHAAAPSPRPHIPPSIPPASARTLSPSPCAFTTSCKAASPLSIAASLPAQMTNLAERPAVVTTISAAVLMTSHRGCQEFQLRPSGPPCAFCCTATGSTTR